MGARCFQNGHFGRILSTLCFTVFQRLGGHASARRVSHEPCFRQAHCFVQGPLRFFPVLPNPTCTRSHIWGLPISYPPNTSVFLPALSHLCIFPSSPVPQRLYDQISIIDSRLGPRPASPGPRPASPGLARSSPGPCPALVSSNLAVKTGKRESY